MKFVDKSAILYLFTISIRFCYAQNCKTTCSSTCSPGCSGNEVCTVGTMTTCGVCPTPKCVSRSTLGLPDVQDPQTNESSSNAGLIGGIVGGLLSVGLIVAAFTYLIIRRRNKNKNKLLPVAFRSGNNNTTMNEEEMQERATSGIIPVSFIPPASSHNSSYTQSEAETPPSHHGSFATFANHNNDSENPFSDRPISNAHSIMTYTTTTTDYRSRRDSTETNFSRQRVASVAHQATQVMRARPQIMRVNTVRIEDDLTRSGSFKKTIQPENDVVATAAPATDAPATDAPATDAPTAITTATVTDQDNPFDDKNKVAITSPIVNATDPKRSNKPTDSVMSAPGDGEITIFWHGNT